MLTKEEAIEIAAQFLREQDCDVDFASAHIMNINRKLGSFPPPESVNRHWRVSFDLTRPAFDFVQPNHMVVEVDKESGVPGVNHMSLY